MRHLKSLLLFALLAACDTGTLQVQPVAEWTPGSGDEALDIAAFRQVSEAVGQEARAECKRRKLTSNCDFRILVDLNPRAEANAFQTLDNKGRPVIIFTQAMLRSAQNSDELAFVMGHEAAHHVLGHINRQSKNAQESAVIFGELAERQGASAEQIESAQQLGAQVGVQVILKEFELEADQLGTIITHNAGYDPLVGARFFARIPDPGDRFLATHPPNAQRVQIVQDTARELGLTE